VFFTVLVVVGKCLRFIAGQAQGIGKGKGKVVPTHNMKARRGKEV
jgi:hypothetical protein